MQNGVFCLIVAKADGGDMDKVELHCRVMLQKETPQGLLDAECGTDVPAGHAGLCR